MKFIAALIITALLSFIAGLYLPWWSIAIAAFIVALLVYQNAGMAFLSGFSGLFLLWSGLAFWIDNGNDSILSARIGELLGIGNNPFLLILLFVLQKIQNQKTIFTVSISTKKHLKR